MFSEILPSSLSLSLFLSLAHCAKVSPVADKNVKKFLVHPTILWQTTRQ